MNAIPMNSTAAPALPDDLDRLREFANVGAGHAASALAQLIGTPLGMTPPEVRTGETAAPRDGCGVFLQVEGGPGGWLGVFFAPAARAALLDAVLREASADPDASRSALAEVGNILASHALSAVSELAGTLILPTPPIIALRHPARRFRELLERAGLRGAPRIENALVDAGGECRGHVVWVPALI